MKLSPSSDETWQFCFNIIEGRTFRQLPVAHNERFIDDSQKVAMNKNPGRYKQIYSDLYKAFPEFKVNMIKALK